MLCDLPPVTYSNQANPSKKVNDFFKYNFFVCGYCLDAIPSLQRELNFQNYYYYYFLETKEVVVDINKFAQKKKTPDFTKEEVLNPPPNHV